MNNQSMQMPELSLADALYICQMIYEAGSIPHLTGKSGIGKTSMMIELAALIGAEFDPALNVHNFSGSGPAEGSGYGVPAPWKDDEDSDLDLRFSVPRGIPTFNRYGFRKVLWVWDEYTNWTPELIAMSRGCITPVGFPKKWGDHIIAPNTYIAITSNRRSDGSRQSAVLDAPNVARVTTLVIQPDMLGTLQHFTALGLADSDHCSWLSYIHSGAKDGGHGLIEMQKYFAPDPVQPWDGQPYPCPRQHEVACRATMPGSSLMLADDHTMKLRLLSGLIGPDAGAQSAAWSSILKDSVAAARRVLDGTEQLDSDDKSAAYSIGMAAYRIVKKPLTGMDQDQRDVAVKGGDLDAFVDRVMLRLPGELRKWVFEMAIRKDGDGNCAIPLTLHDKARAMQCV
jgi:hypothetical protein